MTILPFILATAAIVYAGVTVAAAVLAMRHWWLMVQDGGTAAAAILPGFASGGGGQLSEIARGHRSRSRMYILLSVVLWALPLLARPHIP